MQRHGCVFQESNMRGVATNVYLRKTSEKPEKTRSTNFKWKGSGVVFTHGEGISTPHVRHKRRQPLIECANMTLIFMFPFYVFISFIPFLYFFSFCGRQGCLPLLLRIPQLRWGNQTYVVLSYQVILFYSKGDHFKALDLENDPFYLVRNWNDKLSKFYFFGQAWLGESILTLVSL